MSPAGSPRLCAAETLNGRDPHAKGAMEDFSTWADRVLTVARPA